VLVHNQSKLISPNQINQLIKKGINGIDKIADRIDFVKLGKYEEVHIHFKGGSAVNIDGTFKHVGKPLTKAQKQFLKDIGWVVPE
jgi:hypothetical protein